jgi:hypothetical protein
MLMPARPVSYGRHSGKPLPSQLRSSHLPRRLTQKDLDQLATNHNPDHTLPPPATGSRSASTDAAKSAVFRERRSLI